MSRSTRENQAARWFPSFPQSWIPWTTRLQIGVYEGTGGRLFTKAMGMHHLVMHTIGRKSGRLNKCCLPYWLDRKEHRIVVASLGGGPRNPAWYHNLRDRGANPEVLVRDKRRVFWARAEVLEGEDRANTWREMVVDRPFYRDYQARTERRIPLVRLVESRPYEG
jgi:deazaflavin-dependent oxidoreductase (nitroreductase family)